MQLRFGNRHGVAALLPTCACVPNYCKDVTRIVVKLGTGVLTDSRKQPDLAQMEQLVAQIAAQQRQAGREIVLVSSGAVGAGMGALGYDKRPSDLAELQACAAVGQSRLMAIYEKLFSAYGLAVAQVLLTHDDLEHHERHLNARNTLVTLLSRGVVPIINENDVVSFTELKFGDNDRLSALVASLLPADLLVILTTVDGVIENFGKANPRTIPLIERIDQAVERMAGGTDSATAVGGMASKIRGGENRGALRHPAGHRLGRKKQVLARVVGGEAEGTLFVPQPARLRGRKRWIAFFHHPKGTLFVDAGARKALREGARACCRPASRAAKATSRPATWCGSATWTARSSRAASRVWRRRNQGPKAPARGSGASGRPGDIVRMANDQCPMATNARNPKRDDLSGSAPEVPPPFGGFVLGPASLVIAQPGMKQRASINDLLKIMARLRAPNGCPWDREQDHRSLRWHAVEEVYELMDAIEAGDDHELEEELGDLLLQVVFHCQLAKERGAFDFEKVARRIADKLMRRHPHVFGNVQVKDVDQVWANWERSSARKSTAPGTPGRPRWTASPSTCPPCCGPRS